MLQKSPSLQRRRCDVTECRAVLSEHNRGTRCWHHPSQFTRRIRPEPAPAYSEKNEKQKLLTAVIESPIQAKSPFVLDELEHEKMIPVEDTTAVLWCVCKHYKLSQEAVQGRSLVRTVVRPRMVAMYLLVKDKGRTMTSAGAFLGRDHSTISSAIDKIESAMQDYASDIAAIRSMPQYVLHIKAQAAA